MLNMLLILVTGHPVDMISPVELRVAELMHHMKIETAVAEGAKNVVKQLIGRKVQDRRILAEVGTERILTCYSRHELHALRMNEMK